MDMLYATLGRAYGSGKVEYKIELVVVSIFLIRQKQAEMHAQADF